MPSRCCLRDIYRPPVVACSCYICVITPLDHKQQTLYQHDLSVYKIESCQVKGILNCRPDFLWRPLCSYFGRLWQTTTGVQNGVKGWRWWWPGSSKHRNSWWRVCEQWVSSFINDFICIWRIFQSQPFLSRSKWKRATEPLCLSQRQ